MVKSSQTALLLVGLALGCGSTPRRARPAPLIGWDGVTVTVRNRSRSDVHGLNLRASPSDPWGVERLGPEPLRAGQDRVLRLPACERRDVRLIDARGEECVLDAIDLCAENDSFTLTTDDLLRCARWH
jgi:hypothetical protein